MLVALSATQSAFCQDGPTLIDTKPQGVGPTKYADISGFRVFVNVQEFDKNPKLFNSAFERIVNNIRIAVERIPKNQLSVIQSTPILLVKDNSSSYSLGSATNRQGGAKYYFRKTLTGDRFRGTGMVEISVKHCLSDSDSAKLRIEGNPHWLLHELAHAYHDLALAMEDDKIKLAYEAAIDGSLYRSTTVQLDSIGKKIDVPAINWYAATNEKEYFAELSVVYLAESRRYPYTARDLADYDPRGYKLISNLWKDRKLK